MSGLEVGMKTHLRHGVLRGVLVLVGALLFSAALLFVAEQFGWHLLSEAR